MTENIPKKPGVYYFFNNITNDIYVGATLNLKRRYSEHVSSKKRNYKRAIYSAFEEFGIKNFSFIIIELVDDISLLKEKETEWIFILDGKYNVKKKSSGNVGVKMSDSTINILKKKSKESWENKSFEEKQKIIKNNLTGPKKGYVMPEYQKQRLRELQIGKKWTESQRAKVCASQKISMLGNKNGNKVISSVKDGLIFKTYNSVNEAGKEFGVHPSSITGALKGKTKQSCGYKWIYGNKIN